MRIVDLPAPDAPTSATVRPAGTVSETPSSATAAGSIAEAHPVEADFAAGDGSGRAPGMSRIVGSTSST